MLLGNSSYGFTHQMVVRNLHIFIDIYHYLILKISVKVSTS